MSFKIGGQNINQKSLNLEIDFQILYRAKETCFEFA